MKKLNTVVLVLLLLVTLAGVSDFVAHVHISPGGIMFKVGGVALGLLIGYAAIWAITTREDLSRRRQEEKDNFKFLFSRRLAPDWTTTDDVLARLAMDYGLSDRDVDRIVRDGVHDAVAQYRKSHPLDHSPSQEIDFIHVIPYSDT